MDFIGFTINGQSYAVRIDEAIATIRTPTMASVPGSPSSVMGMFSYHGEFVPVIDLSKLYTEEIDEHPEYVIIVQGHTKYGILADTIEDIIRNDVPDDFVCLSIHDIEATVKQPPRQAGDCAVELF